jgi:hypothetical protein
MIVLNSGDGWTAVWTSSRGNAPPRGLRGPRASAICPGPVKDLPRFAGPRARRCTWETFTVRKYFVTPSYPGPCCYCHSKASQMASLVRLRVSSNCVCMRGHYESGCEECGLACRVRAGPDEKHHVRSGMTTSQMLSFGRWIALRGARLAPDTPTREPAPSSSSPGQESSALTTDCLLWRAPNPGV